jgi:DNA-binding NarL/FixJ family response regulator
MTHVLIIEKNQNFCSALKSLMNSRYTAIVLQEAANAAEAFEKMNNATPDIIFSDISHSADNSLELIGHARKKCPAAIIVTLSSESNAEYKNAAIKNGANYHFPKSSLNLDVMDELFKANSI